MPPRASAPALARHRSFPPVVTPNTRLLLLGSLPGAASLAAARYYAHPQNQFWRLVGGVIECDLTALDYDARLAALADAGIGLWDMVAEATREGSLDSAIRDHAANDLGALAATLPALCAIGFNGGTAAALARRHAAAATAHYTTVALPSSSPAYTLPFAEKQARWRILRDFLRPVETNIHASGKSPA
jgi:double-stranded uracil-DNA glycosylase